MTKPNEKLVEFPRQSARDILTDVLRDGAQQMLATVIEAEVDDYLAGRASTVDAAGRRYVVRNGHLPPRAIQTPLGDVQVQQPRVRDRRPTDERETFRSAILPPYLRKTPSLEALYPWLYLKGISTGDFGEALQALLGHPLRPPQARFDARRHPRGRGPDGLGHPFQRAARGRTSVVGRHILRATAHVILRVAQGNPEA